MSFSRKNTYKQMRVVVVVVVVCVCVCVCGGGVDGRGVGGEWEYRPSYFSEENPWNF